MTLKSLILCFAIAFTGLVSSAQSLPIGKIGGIPIGIGPGGITIGNPRTNYPPPPGPGPGYPGDPQQGGQVCFYSDANFQGFSLCRAVGQSESNLDYFGFNNRISSIRFFGYATVTIYEGENFSGARMELGRDIPNLGNSVWNDNISSFVVGGGGYNPPPPYPPPSYDQICFYENRNFSGASFCMYRGQRIYNLGENGGYWNDRISSVRVFGNVRATVYHDANLSGIGLNVTQDIFDLSTVFPWNVWNDEISSIIVE